MEEVFNNYIMTNLEKSVEELTSILQQNKLNSESVEEVRLMTDTYTSLKNKILNDNYDLTQYEKDLITRIGCIILREEFNDKIHNTKSTYHLVVKKNKQIIYDAHQFLEYFNNKFKDY